MNPFEADMMMTEQEMIKKQTMNCPFLLSSQK